MNPSSQSPRMLVVPITPATPESGTPFTSPSLLSRAGSAFPSLAPSPSTEEEEYYYHPLATSSSIYDTEIDNISDLDPNNPIALSDFLTRIGPSLSATPSPSCNPSSNLSSAAGKVGGAEYDADDEDSMEGMEYEMEYATEELSVTSEEEEDDREMNQLEFIHYMNRDCTLDPDADWEGEHPALTRSAISSDSNFSCRSPRYALPRRHYYAHHGRNTSGEVEVASAEPRSSTTTPSPGTVEYHESFAGPSHHPEAVQFFAVDRETGEFANPFTTPGSGNAARSESEPSPRTLMRVNDYGLIENWNFETRDEGGGSPVSSLSNYGQSVDDGVPVSPLLESRSVELISACLLRSSDEGRERREPEVLGLIPANTGYISSQSPQSTSGPEIFSAINAQLNDLIFERAAYEFFCPINDEALVADQASSSYSFIDHDTLHRPRELELEWPYRHWLPHEPSRRCHCWWCIEYWMPEEDEYRPHDFDRRCSCPVCESFRWQGCAREMEARERELEKSRERKWKQQESEANIELSKANGDVDEATDIRMLRRETRKINAKTEDEAGTTKEWVRKFQDEGERNFAERRTDRTHGQDDEEEQESMLKNCLRLFRWVRRQLRELEE